MRTAIAALVLLLAGLGVVLFLQHRSAPSTIAPTAFPVAVLPSQPTPISKPIGNNDEPVQSARKPAGDSKSQTVLSSPNSNVGNSANSGSVGSSAPAVILTDPVTSAAGSVAEDEGFLKKYGQTSMEERRRALEDLQMLLQSLTDGSQPTPVAPEVLSELKREMGWLESHLDS